MNDAAVITGGAAGIGLQVARRLAADGHGVVILDLEADKAEAAARDLGDNSKAIGLGCDVAHLAAVQEAAERIHAAGWSVSQLVSNAGWGPNRRFLESSVDEQQRIIDVNFGGALNVCRVFLPDMVSNRHGRIVLVGSDAGRVGTPKEAVYAGTKAALVGFAKSLAVEIARDNVTINVVSPGSTDTEFIRSILTEDQLARRIKGNPLGRLATPDDVADAICFFLGDASSYITGQVLSVNGSATRPG